MNLRDQCKHGRHDHHALNDERQWVGCPGGRPVVTKCGTCNGNGIKRDDTYENVDFYDVCPDCVAGRVTNQGTIRRRCLKHDADEIEPDYCYVQQTQGLSDCVFGLVLVVPLDTEEM